MKLGSLINLLGQCDPDLPVQFSDGRYPGEFDSWRGRYHELTLTGGSEPVTCGQLLAKAESANGGMFTGYKGGEFLMDENTGVWADEYGECRCDAIVGAERSKKLLTITVLNIEEYV